MGGQSTMNNEPINPKPNRLKALALIEIGLFELGFVAIILLLFFGILNYFNILSVSDLFPHQLGWLPRREAPNGASHQKIRQSTVATPTPSGFNYDVKKAQALLTQYLKDTIRPEFLPSKIDVQENLIASGKKNGTDYEFGANWKTNEDLFNATFHYLLNTNQIRDTEFYINTPYIKNSVNSSDSDTLVKTYLKNIPNELKFDCGVFKETTRFCEYFKINEAGKNGFGTIKSKDESGKDILLIFSCFIPKNDSYYTRRTSCLLFREKDPTGL